MTAVDEPIQSKEPPKASTSKPSTPRRRSKGNPILLAHWKGFRSFEEAEATLEKLSHYSGKRHLHLALPFNHLEKLSAKLTGPSLSLGCSSMASAQEGTFTESVAADLVKSAGGNFVLIADHDARQQLKETNEEIQAKIKKCVSEGLVPILGIGESLEDYQSESTESVLRQQLEAALEGLSARKQGAVTIAYDCCWSLRFNSDTATAERFEAVDAQIRSLLEELVGATVAKKIKILVALPPYLDDLSMIPKAKVDGFYMSKTSVMPDSLSTIAPPEAFEAPADAEEPEAEVEKEAEAEPPVPKAEHTEEPEESENSEDATDDSAEETESPQPAPPKVTLEPEAVPEELL